MSGLVGFAKTGAHASRGLIQVSCLEKRTSVFQFATANFCMHGTRKAKASMLVSKGKKQKK